MSENRNTGLRRGARIAGVGAAAAVALGLLSTGAANADTFVPLPDGQKVGTGASRPSPERGERADFAVAGRQRRGPRRVGFGT